VRPFISLVIAGMQLELLAIPLFCVPLSLGLKDLALLLSILFLLSISFMASAWNRTGKALPYLLNLTHALMCELNASSFFFPPFFSNSSFTASAHKPHTHFPKNFSRTRSMYSGVHSSHIPQHSHLASITSVIGWSDRSIPSLVSSNEMSEIVLWMWSFESLGGLHMLLLFLEIELGKHSPLGAILLTDDTEGSVWTRLC